MKLKIYSKAAIGYAILVAVCLFILFGSRTSAQVFSLGIGVTNTTTNGIVQNSLVSQTNTVFAFMANRTLSISNISTNETVIYSYGFTWSGLGATNLQVPGGFITNTFPLSNGWGTNLVWTTNIPAVTLPVNITPWGTLTVQTGSNTVLLQ